MTTSGRFGSTGKQEVEDSYEVSEIATESEMEKILERIKNQQNADDENA